MAYRMEAVRRIVWALIFVLLITPVFWLVWGTVALVAFVLDVLWQLVMGSEGLGWGNALTEAYDWYTENIEYLLTGKGDANVLPYV